LPSHPHINSLTSRPPLLQGKGAKGERLWRLSIRDNGKGFDPDKLEFPGNGLINMRKRMTEIDGEFIIRSTPGEGTVLHLLILH